MDEQNKNTGELSGFDSVEDNKNNAGYTVTNEGGFYNGVQQDKPEQQQVQQPDNSASEPVQDNIRQGEYSFIPNGTYGVNYNQFNNTIPNEPKKVYIPRPPKQKKHRQSTFSFKAVIAFVVAAAIIGASSATGVMLLMNGKTEKSGIVSTEQNNDSGSANVTNITVDKTDYTAVEAIAEKVTPSVVGIRTTAAVTSFFYGSTEQTGEGSGIIYSSDGYIVTNYHVIESAVESTAGNSKIEVFLNGDTDKGYQATVIGYNITYDIAVLKIEASNLPAIQITDSDKIKVGQFTAAIGNPGGLEYMSSVTYGIISGLNRSVSEGSDNTSDVSYIQTDAAINPGNSGGALVDIEGNLIGVNSVKIVSESYEGMGFAIPANKVVELAKKIIERQYEPIPYIGVTLSERYDANTLKMLGYPAGAVVQSVADGSPAAESNIKRGDIITEFAGKEMTGYSSLTQAIADCTPGDNVEIKIYRSGRYYTVNITIGSDNSAQ